jgi:hypothetical protein
MPTPPRQTPDNEPAELRTSKSATPKTEEERRVWEIMETSRQNVKSVAKRELEAEVLPTGLLSFRLKRR